MTRKILPTSQTHARRALTLLETLLATVIFTLAAVALLPLQRSLLRDPQKIAVQEYYHHLASTWTWQEWQQVQRAQRTQAHNNTTPAEVWQVTIKPLPTNASSLYIPAPSTTEEDANNTTDTERSTSENPVEPVIWHTVTWSVIHQNDEKIAHGIHIIAAPFSVPEMTNQRSPKDEG